MNRRTLLQLTAAALLPASLPAPKPSAVRIGWLRGPNDITLGRARGTIERRTRRPRRHGAVGRPVRRRRPGALEALNAGAIDVTAGSSTASIAGLAAGVPFVVFAYQKMSARPPRASW